MVKKNNNSFKGIFREFLDKSIGPLFSLIENINVTEWLNDILHPRSKIKKYTIVLILSIAALIVLMLGVASYIMSQIPEVGNGVGEILIGLILAIVALIYYNLR